jgi:nucleotide-binding universal stress UspA family protein
VIGTHPVEALLAEAAAMPAGMLVMGAYEHSGLRVLLTGSATKHLLRRAPCAIFAAH